MDEKKTYELEKLLSEAQPAQVGDLLKEMFSLFMRK